MRRLPRRMNWSVHRSPVEDNPNLSRVHVHLGEDVYALTIGEALMMADQLVDQSELLQQPKEHHDE